MRTNAELRANYEALYRVPDYGLSHRRQQILEALPWRDFAGGRAGVPTFIDVGCGHGEAIRMAESHGFEASGFEIVPALCDGERVRLIETAADLPCQWHEADLVGCFDVLEHVLPDETEDVLAELCRVAGVEVWLNISTSPGFLGHRKELGDPHINVRPAEAWVELLEDQGVDVEVLEKTEKDVTLRASHEAIRTRCGA